VLLIEQLHVHHQLRTHYTIKHYKKEEKIDVNVKRIIFNLRNRRGLTVRLANGESQCPAVLDGSMGKF
jgi:hypothetical protein